MHTKTILTTAILALAGSALVTSAQATTYVDGDLFLGFRATSGTGNTNTYLINIGQYAQYRDALTTGFALNLGNIKVDLDATFGAGWSSLGTVRWGVFGLSQTNNLFQTNVLFGTKPEATIGVHPAGWAKRSDAQQGATGQKVLNLAQQYLIDTGSFNAPKAVIENTTEVNDWTEFQPAGSQSTATTSFGIYSPTIEGNFGLGTAGTRLDLYNITNTGDTGSGAAPYIGTFSITDTGGATTVTYNGTVAAPEPTSALLLGMGTCLLGFVRRRTSVTA